MIHEALLYVRPGSAKAPIGVRMVRRWIWNLARISEQPSESCVSTQGDDLELQQTRPDNRELSDESLGFRRVAALKDQHGPRLVVGTQIKLTHPITLVEFPYVARLFAHVRSDVFPPYLAPGTPNGQSVPSPCTPFWVAAC